MEIIARNAKLRFEYVHFIKFTELFKDVTEIGNGYTEPTGTASVSNNIVVTSKKHTGVKFKFITGHKYLVLFKTKLKNMWASSSNAYNYNGIRLSNEDGAELGTPKIVKDNLLNNVNFTTYPYISIHFPVAPTKAEIEIYIYDITGYEDEKFANITYEDMKSGMIKIVDTNV